jgi:hypothetical protein
MKKLFSLIFVIFLSFLFSCVETSEKDFREEYIVEAFIVVGEPVNNIRFMRTIPILDTFSLERAMIRDAEIYIESETGQKINLEMSNNIRQGYKAIDQSYLIEEDTRYKINIVYNFDTIKGETITPKKFNWIDRAPKQIQYPIDSIGLSDQINVKWENPGGFNFYHIVIRCIDTLNYGKYLEPPTEELNRRISLWRDQDFFFRNTTNHGLVPLNEGSIIWTTFKWYGMQEVTIYNPDFNWFRWLGQYFQTEYNDILSSVEGRNARGVFGSASAIKDTSFLLKNQP